jgi:hypothetical protein
MKESSDKPELLLLVGDPFDPFRVAYGGPEHAGDRDDMHPFAGILEACGEQADLLAGLEFRARVIVADGKREIVISANSKWVCQKVLFQDVNALVQGRHRPSPHSSPRESRCA